MKIIEISGNADKKLLVYIMAKSLSVENKVCIVTDDVTYRRLLRGEQQERVGNAVAGSISDVDVIIKLGVTGAVDAEGLICDLGEDLVERLSSLDRQYDFVIVPAEFIKCGDADSVVECIQIDRAFESEDEELIKFNDDSDVVEETTNGCKLRLTVKQPSFFKKDNAKEVGVEKAIIYGSSLNYIYTCEEYKRLLAYVDKGLMVPFSKVISKCTGYDRKQIEKLMGLDDKEGLSKKGR